MATLTTEQILEVRRKSGDVNLTNPDVDNQTLQYYFDQYCEGRLDYLIVHVLRDRVGISANNIRTTNEQGIQADRQLQHEQLERLLKRWEARTGLGDESSVSTGYADLALGDPDDDYA